MEEVEECRKYRMDYGPNNGVIGGLITLLLFAGVPFMFIAGITDPNLGSLFWKLLVAILASLSLLLIIATTAAYFTISVNDPNIMIQRCKEEWEEHWPRYHEANSDIEKLAVVYSVAVERTHEGFKGTLLIWLTAGIGLTLLEYGSFTGNITLSDGVVRLSGLIFMILGPINFVLMVWSYLRYRRYTKELFAIQLKKSDKAEISIKI
ncbi:hypothetical protein [Thermococcus sp.]|uniref:hypothetical protein n=2 Tax=Thermococcus sp. TaxID=35749 RepID=UPI00260A1E8D|nr:hypothetical protein [Thermococcus sp.]